MRPEEISALGEVTGDAVREVALQARDVHAGIARRVFRAVGPAAVPVRIVHDVIARGAYTAAGELGRVAVRGGAGAVALAASVGPGSALAGGALEDSAGGRAVVGVLNGAVGDALARRGNRLAVPMTLRSPAGEVEVSFDGLRRAYPGATSRLVLFIHGLGQTEDAWGLRASRHAPYGGRLAAELGYTPMYVRYNSGRHISENGGELAGLLEQVVAGWPVEVSEIALVGHSVGGLVARSACYCGAGRTWSGLVRQVISLGTAHRGTVVERAVSATAGVLARIPETRPVAHALELRSAAIKDLGHGGVVDEHWSRGGGERYAEIPYLGSASYYFVSAGGLSPVGRASAWAHPGGGEPMRFPVDHYREICGAGYFDLLNHPAVYGVIRAWLEPGGRALPGPRPQLSPGD
jgi:pimeloyl-ACP methyl ester carboxylesterase